MNVLFLLHDPADRQFAHQLAARLADQGAVVWLDQGSEIGDPLGAKMRAALDAAGRALVVVSSNSVRSDSVDALASALDLTRTTHSRTVVPIMIDACGLPAGLANHAWADFRDPERFDASVEGLLAMLDLPARRGSGIAIEWTGDGPGVFARGVAIPPSEGRTLLDAWRASLPDLVARQTESGRAAEEAGPAASLLAATRAFGDSYGRVPSPLELAAGTSEPARKLDLLYVFFELMYEHAARA